MAVVTVRFYVGEDREDSLIKLYNKIAMNTDIVPPGVTGWVVKPIEIDDVPIVNVTLWSERYNDHELRRVAEQVEIQLQSVRNTARTEIVGGRRRQISVWLDPERLAAHNVTALQVVAGLARRQCEHAVRQLCTRQPRGVGGKRSVPANRAKEIESLVVGVHAGRPVYVRDVARSKTVPKSRHTTRGSALDRPPKHHSETPPVGIATSRPSPLPWPNRRAPTPSMWRMVWKTSSKNSSTR